MHSKNMTDIRIITQDNGAGLVKDAELLTAALKSGFFRVMQNRFKTNKVGKWLQRIAIQQSAVTPSINIFLERLHPSLFGSAKLNVLMPNPEWTLPKWLPYLRDLDFVLVKTRHAETIFSELGCKTRYTGFSSEDRWLPEVAREAGFFHLAGKSSNKGTESLIALWRKHPHWPLLTIVQHPNKAECDANTHNIRHVLRYLDDAELKLMQNQHQFHLCISDTEGFGHYLMEAMSMQAVVITTDAPPMNELVTAERGLLVGYDRTSRQNLATCYHVAEAQLEATIERALLMSTEHATRLGREARKFFLQNDMEFRQRIHMQMADIANIAHTAKSH